MRSFRLPEVFIAFWKYMVKFNHLLSENWLEHHSSASPRSRSAGLQVIRLQVIPFELFETPNKNRNPTLEWHWRSRKPPHIWRTACRASLCKQGLCYAIAYVEIHCRWGMTNFDKNHGFVTHLGFLFFQNDPHCLHCSCFLLFCSQYGYPQREGKQFFISWQEARRLEQEETDLCTSPCRGLGKGTWKRKQRSQWNLRHLWTLTQNQPYL